MVINVSFTNSEAAKAIVDATSATSEQGVLDTIGEAGLIFVKRNMEHAMAKRLYDKASDIDLVEVTREALFGTDVDWK